MAVTLFKIDGYEHGRTTSASLNVWDVAQGAVTMVTSPVRTGLRALQVAPAGAAASGGYNLTAGTRVATMAFYIRFATLPSALVGLAVFVNASGNSTFQIGATNQFQVAAGGVTPVATGVTVATNTWYRVVVELDATTGTHTIRARIDGGTEISDTAALAAADITAARFGTLGAQTYTAFYDDFLLSITDGDYEELNTWTGHAVESLIPSSDGTHSGFASGDFDSNTTTAFTTSTTNGYTFIAHRPLNAAATAEQSIRQDVAGTSAYMEFGLENLTVSGTVQAVRAYATHVESATSGASLAEAQLLLSDNTEVLTTGSLSVIDSTEDPGTTVTIRPRMTIAPSGGWDRTKVDGLKARIGFGDAVPVPTFCDFMIEVALDTTVVAVTMPPKPVIVTEPVTHSYEI